jgi:hypothetical protein
MEALNVCYLIAIADVYGTLRNNARSLRTTAGPLLRELSAELGRDRSNRLRGAASPRGKGRPDNGRPRGKLRNAEDLGIEKPRRAPGDWHPKPN